MVRGYHLQAALRSVEGQNATKTQVSAVKKAEIKCLIVFCVNVRLAPPEIKKA